MQELEKSQNLIRAFLAGFASVTALELEHLINGQWFVAGSIATVAVVVIGSYLDYFIDKSARLRWIITRGDTIEGWWIDFSFDSATRILKHFVMFKVSYEEHTFKVSGFSYNCACEKIAQWHALNAGYSNRTLLYIYESQTEYVSNGVERGFAELLFDTPPTAFRGQYHQINGNIGSQVKGRRVSTKDLKEFAGLKDESARERFASELVARWNKEHTTPAITPESIKV
jgi:hypothetical protein